MYKSSGSTDDALVEFEGGRRRMAQQALAGRFTVAACGRELLWLARLIFFDDFLQIVLVVVEHFAAHFGCCGRVGEQRNRQRLLQHKLGNARRVFLFTVLFVFFIVDDFLQVHAGFDDFNGRVAGRNCRDGDVCGLYGEDFL